MGCRQVLTWFEIQRPYERRSGGFEPANSVKKTATVRGSKTDVGVPPLGTFATLGFRRVQARFIAVLLIREGIEYPRAPVLLGTCPFRKEFQGLGRSNSQKNLIRSAKSYHHPNSQAKVRCYARALSKVQDATYPLTPKRHRLKAMIVEAEDPDHRILDRKGKRALGTAL